ncbi:MAG: transporter [Bacteroidota bacterium]
MKTRLLICILLAAFICFGGGTPLSAQLTMAERPSTEQPGFYVSAYTLYPGNLVIENTFSYSRANDVINTTSASVPATLVRYGVTEGFEIRVRGQARSTAFRALGMTTSDFSVGDWGIGAKINLVPPGKKFPPLSLVTFVQLPQTSTFGVAQSQLAPSLLLATHFPLFGALTGTVNLGAAWSGLDLQPNYQYAFALEREITTGLTAFVEAYGGIVDPDIGMNHNYDAGLVWGLSPSLQFDVSGGYQIDSATEINAWFAAGGVSIRVIPKRNRN